MKITREARQRNAHVASRTNARKTRPRNAHLVRFKNAHEGTPRPTAAHKKHFSYLTEHLPFLNIFPQALEQSFLDKQAVTLFEYP